MANVITIFLIIIISLIDCCLCQSGEDISEEDDAVAFLLNNEVYPNVTSNISSIEFSLLDTYLPLFILVLDMPIKEKEVLQSYLTDKTYEKLKYDIDAKVKMYPESVLSRLNTTILDGDINRFDDITRNVVQGYHNASVYNAIRSVYLKQLRPFLPLIDQMAIMQYFTQRKISEYERMSIWARIWENVSGWMYGRQENLMAKECYAMEPKCVRSAMEKLNMEERIDLDNAAMENQFDSVDGIIRNKLNSKGDELDDWLHRNRPPRALETILDERSDVEEEALQRLRDNGVLSSLKHYYKAVIETRNTVEQEEIRKFFETMNDTFARCFDPLRGQFHDF